MLLIKNLVYIFGAVLATQLYNSAHFGWFNLVSLILMILFSIDFAIYCGDK